MELSKETCEILKNFSVINQSIYIKQGNTLYTKSISGNIYGEVQIEEDFPMDVAIYDLNQFLNTLKLFSTPILEFKENFMNIIEKDDLDYTVKYVYADPEHIVYPDRKPNLPSGSDVSVELSKENFDSLIKASNVLSLPNIVVTPKEEGVISVEVCDIKDSSTNNFSILVRGEHFKNDFKLIMNTDTLKVIPDDYELHFYGNKICGFFGNNKKYIIGLNQKSIYKD